MLRDSTTIALGLILVTSCNQPSNLAPGDDTPTTQAATATMLGDPFPQLPTALQERFDTGADEFTEEEDVAEGLGPVFNGTACAACHSIPAVGGAGTQIETRFGRVVNGTFDALAFRGGSLIQAFGIEGVEGCTVSGEVVPPEANVSTGRRTTPLFGLGLVDAVPAATLMALADKQPVAVRGRVNLVSDPNTGALEVGKFGWKAHVASLQTFSGDAYVNEMGITSPAFPVENCPQGDCSILTTCDTVPDAEDDGSNVAAFRDFMTLLAPPPTTKRTGQAAAGEQAFSRIGCVDCHVDTLRTGPSPIAALNRTVFHPYSDFLLHDMGPLGDGIPQGRATGREMRTAPLWGVSQEPSFLHDGRASTLEQAILAHDGQARPARDRFAAMNDRERAKIIAFLEAL